MTGGGSGGATGGQKERQRHGGDQPMRVDFVSGSHRTVLTAPYQKGYLTRQTHTTQDNCQRVRLARGRSLGPRRRSAQKGRDSSPSIGWPAAQVHQTWVSLVRGGWASIRAPARTSWSKAS